VERDPEEHEMTDDERDLSDLTPEEPREAGVDVPSPRIEDVEPVRMLDNEARERLVAAGFTDDQVLQWVEAYFAASPDGEVDGLIAFIREREGQT
jgi:hypothetical protein